MFLQKYYPQVVNWDELRTIVVYQGKHLGDALLITPVLAVLLKVSRADIYVCTTRANRPLVTDDSKVHYIEHRRGFLRALSTGLRIKNINPDLFLDFHDGLESSIASFITRAPTSLSVTSSSKKRFFKYVTHQVKYRSGMRRHRIDLNLDLLRRLGLEILPEQKHLDARFALGSSRGRQHCNKQVSSLLVIHPGSRWLFKTPKIEFWIALLERLKITGWTDILLTGLLKSHEGVLLEELARKSHAKLCPADMSLRELSQTLAGARAYIGVDTFSSHLASALRIPGVVLFGPSDELSWGPYEGSLLRAVSHSKLSCRPCNIDGCGGGKRSECLDSLDIDLVINTFIDQVNYSNEAVEKINETENF